MEAPQFIKRLFGLKDPRRAAKLVADGVVMARNGDTTGALRAYRDAVSADPEYALGHLNVALALQDQFNDVRAGLTPEEQEERLQEMEAALGRACQLDPAMPPAWRARGYVARARGDHVEARRCFQTYLQDADARDPHRDRVQALLADVEELARVQEALAAGLATVEAGESAGGEKEAEAEKQLLYVVQKQPGTPQAWWALGVLARRREKTPQKALEYLGRALEADRAFIPAHKELSSIHFLAGQAQKALPHARAAFEADPGNAGLVCNLGVCHLAVGQLDEAREFITLARNISSKDPIVLEAFKALEEALRAAGQPLRR